MAFFGQISYIFEELSPLVLPNIMKHHCLKAALKHKANHKLKAHPQLIARPMFLVFK